MGRVVTLTPKQQTFVDEYLIDLNATQAAIRAGYSSNRASEIGYQLLHKTTVRAAIDAAQAKRSERTEITQDMVLRELAKIGFADIRKVVRWGNTEIRLNDGSDDGFVEAYHGLALTSSDQVDDETAAAIAEISQGKEGLKVKFHDKRAALVDMGRHLGMFKERVEHTGKDGGPIEVASLSREEYLQARKDALADDDC